MKKLFHIGEYFQEKYSQPLQRIGIDLALGCPHRSNGGFGDGCIFCTEDGARARHLTRVGLNLVEQVACGIEYVKKRYGENVGLIAYFQSFTSTNAPVSRLRELYSLVLSQADFKVVIVSTRPDALPDEVLDYLEELNEKYELFVELGIQSACDRTLQEINRGHDFAAVKNACARLKKRNLKVAGHFILGLPGEDFNDWMYTAAQAAALQLDAVKIHQLMVLKNTVLAQRCNQNSNYVKPLNEYDYAAALKSFLQRLPENTLLMRLMGDAPESELISPRWWMKKGQFLSFFKEYFYSDNTQNGNFVLTHTADGTPTLYHPRYRQHFHSLAGAGSEAEKKFAEPSALPERLQKSASEKRPLRLLDIGFGLGGNSFAALAHSEKVSGCALEITALEFDLRTLQAALNLYNPNSKEFNILQELINNGFCRCGNSEIKLLLDDARNTIRKLPEKSFDLLWLDAFSSDVNPELWSQHFFAECFRVMRNDGALLTYSSAPTVRGGLFKAGFTVGETPSFGRKRSGSIAFINIPQEGFVPLSEKEKHIIFDSTAGVPYSDCSLNAAPEKILSQHKKLLERLRRRGVPKWYREKTVKN